MKLTAYLFLLLLFACGQNKSGEKNNTTDSPASVTTDSTAQLIDQPALPVITEAAKEISGLLTEKFGDSFEIVTDSIARWPQDVFDYFIAPKRKTEPDYPYITKGDFNGDGQQDAAALVRLNNKAEYQLAILFGSPLDKNRIQFWKEDIDICAVSLYPKGDLQGIDKPKVKMKGDGINVEYYESAAFVIYWDGKTFKRAYTAD